MKAIGDFVLNAFGVLMVVLLVVSIIDLFSGGGSSCYRDAKDPGDLDR